MGDREQPKKFAERLNQAIESRKISARELGARAGISETSISKYRKGIGMPARGKIINLAKTLGVSTGWLLGYSDDVNSDLTPQEKLRNRIDNLLERMDLSQLEDTELLIKKFILKDN